MVIRPTQTSAEVLPFLHLSECEKLSEIVMESERTIRAWRVQTRAQY